MSISLDSDVITITDKFDYIIRYTKVSAINYGFISKSSISKLARKDWIDGFLLKEISLEEINRCNYIVIE